MGERPKNALERGDVASAEDLVDRLQPGAGPSFAERYPRLANETMRERAFREVMEAPDDLAAEVRIAQWLEEDVLSQADADQLREERRA